MRSIPKIEILRRVWVQDFAVIEGKVQWRKTDNIHPSSLRINSPYDTEARYAHKRSTTRVGYKARLTETCSAKSKRRTINIKPQELREALQQARKREKTEEFKKKYKKRAGIEGTISQCVRAFGMRRSRYMGRAKSHLQHLATAAAINKDKNLCFRS
jgi:hypothetical protein